MWRKSSLKHLRVRYRLRAREDRGFVQGHTVSLAKLAGQQSLRQRGQSNLGSCHLGGF